MAEHVCELTPMDSETWETTIGVEVVRCRDCKFMHTVKSWLVMDVDECWLHASPETGALGRVDTEPDGFCAWGERREDE